MLNDVLRIATRKSPLALWQANYVASLLKKRYPDLVTELVQLTTKGDEWLDKPLYEVGGKGLFLKELEQALLNGSADIAVHSMKDVPAVLPNKLCLEVILERKDPWDVLISRNNSSLQELPVNAIVGTSSLRRKSQIQQMRPDITVQALRGNVGTRLKQLDDKKYDAIVLAQAGLMRLELSHRISYVFSKEECLPAAGQGAIGIESRRDAQLGNLLKSLNDSNTTDCVHAERGFNETLGGSCHSPIAAFAELNQGQLTLTGGVFAFSGKQRLLGNISGEPEEAKQLGVTLANQLIAQGAMKLLNQIQ